MTSPDQKTVSTNTPATVVPSGESIVIPAGSLINITHRLGGNFTVTWEYGMARISGIYAQNIGEETPEWVGKSKKTEKKANDKKNKNGKKEDEDDSPPGDAELWEVLKTVYDPEIPVNIVDLGLVYSLDVEPLSPTENGKKIDGYKIWMKMTLTAPGCGMGPSIAADAKERLLQLQGVKDAQVDIVWDPPWNQNMISEEGKMQLGLL